MLDFELKESTPFAVISAPVMVRDACLFSFSPWFCFCLVWWRNFGYFIEDFEYLAKVLYVEIKTNKTNLNAIEIYDMIRAF